MNKTKAAADSTVDGLSQQPSKIIWPVALGCSWGILWESLILPVKFLGVPTEVSLSYRQSENLVATMLSSQDFNWLSVAKRVLNTPCCMFVQSQPLLASLCVHLACNYKIWNTVWSTGKHGLHLFYKEDPGLTDIRFFQNKSVLGGRHWLPGTTLQIPHPECVTAVGWPCFCYQYTVRFMWYFSSLIWVWLVLLKSLRLLA